MPGNDYTITGSPFVYTSPMLQEGDDRMLMECPVGHTLREAPHTYQVLEFCRLGESLSPLELSKMPMYFRKMFQVYSSECARLEELKHATEALKADSAYGAKVLRSR